MDRYLSYVFIICYVCISWTECEPVFIRHKRSLQESPSLGDNGHLTDVSHRGNDRSTDSGRTNHDHVAVGQGQTDQSLLGQSSSDRNGNQGNVGRLYDSNGQLVADSQSVDHHSTHGTHDVGHGQNSAVQDHDNSQQSHQNLLDDHGSLGHDSLDHLNVVNSSAGIAGGSDGSFSGSHRDSFSAGQSSASGGHQASDRDNDGLTGQRSAIISHAVISHGVLQQQSDGHDGHNSFSDGVSNANNNRNADSLLRTSDNTGQSQNAIDHHDSSLQNSPVVDSDDGLLNPVDTAIGVQDDHHSTTSDTHQHARQHSDSDTVSDLFDDNSLTDYDYDSDADDYVIPDNVINIHQNVLTDDHDRGAEGHIETAAGHDNSLPVNRGDIHPNNPSNDSEAIPSHAHSNGGSKDSDSIVGGDSHIPNHHESHFDGSGSSSTGSTTISGGHLGRHEVGGDGGFPIDLDISHLSGHENLDGHGSHIDDGNPDRHDNPGGHGPVIVGPDPNVDSGVGGHIPGADHSHNEGSGGHPGPGRTEHGDNSVEQGQIPGHNSPAPSHDGHEVHPDNLPSSGDGPVIDKDGGVHLSHHENPEHEHIEPAGPRHSELLTTASTTTSASTTAVKVIILPTPVQPETVGGDGNSHGPHEGDEVEGSGSEGHPVVIATTPNRDHEGQGHGNEGHIVAVTTTASDHHATEGSASGEGHGDGHEIPLPAEGSGQEHEEHDGHNNASGDKPVKEPNKGEEPKVSSVVSPSEVDQLQPSADIFRLPIFGSSTEGFSSKTESVHPVTTTYQITETETTNPSITESVTDSYQRMSDNSQLVKVQSSLRPTPEYTVTSVLMSNIVSSLTTDSSIQHSSFSQYQSQSTFITESPIGIESEPVNQLTTRLTDVSTAIETSAVVLDSSSSGLKGDHFTSTLDSETITPTQSLQEITSGTSQFQTSQNLKISSADSTSLFPSSSITPSNFPSMTHKHSEIDSASSHTNLSDSVSTYAPTSLSRISEQTREITSTRQFLSASGSSSSAAGQTISNRPKYTSSLTSILTSESRTSATSPTTQSTTVASSVTARKSTESAPRISFSNSLRPDGQGLSTLTHFTRPSSSVSSNNTLTMTTNVSTVLTSLSSGSSRTSVVSFLSFSSTSTSTTTTSRPNTSFNYTSSSEAYPSVPASGKSSLSPLLTTLLSTTKRKNISSNVTIPTTTSPSKKPASPVTKAPDKPETVPIVISTSRGRTIISQHTNTNRSTNTNRPVETERTTIAPIHEVRTTSRPALSTPPPVFVQVQLRMTWTEFCSDKSYFIADLREIIHTEKQVLIAEERFIINFPSEYCRMANYIEEEPLMSTQIEVQVYIIDSKGRVDITLTKDLSTVIEKGFKSLTSRFKDKFVAARLFAPEPTTSVPRQNSPVREAKRSTGITMVTVIASVGGACCVILIILQIMIRRRIIQKKMRPYVWGQRASLQSLDHVALGVIPKSRPDSGYWNPALEHEEIPEPSPHSHLVNFAGLANFSLDKNGIYEEFQMIPFETPEKSEVPIGVEEKNRFANILPFKATRVRLHKKEGEDDSEYINANFIKGYKKAEGAYIATQSPMMNTAEDFWRMVWEKGSRVILMLNPLSDTGKPKMCTMYWPDGEGSECVKQFGDFAVTLKKKDVQPDYIETTLQLRDMERSLKRDIHHFWFTTWPETGLPEPLAFVKFILDARPRYEDTGTPVVVHCGPGTGRTGVLIAVDVCMRMFEEKRRVDVLQCVHQMRRERAGTVQTRDQYALIYQALNEYAVILSSPSMSTRSSVITLHAML